MRRLFTQSQFTQSRTGIRRQGAKAMNSPLKWEVFISPQVAVITMEQNQALAEWVAASGKNLTTIYATHGHGDHFFGVNTIQQRFPDARFVACPEAISVMREQLSPPWLEAYWKSRFPGQIDPALPIAEELAGGVFQLDGAELVS